LTPDFRLSPAFPGEPGSPAADRRRRLEYRPDSVAAGLAWYIAHTPLGHHQPFFAPTAAAVSLSKNTMLRGQHALQLIVGAVLGIGIGAAVKAWPVQRQTGTVVSPSPWR
jgi:Fusaric acid resistance protein-like